MRTKPYECMICGQVEPLHYDDEWDIEYYSDDPEHDVIEWWLHDFELPGGKLTIRACGNCSKMAGPDMLTEYKRRVREGEILIFH